MRGGLRVRTLDQTLIALADPTRRAILRRLAQGEARVAGLARPFPISLNSVSKHIKLLERAKLVERRRVGREHRLRFRTQPLTEVQQWIAKQQAFWKSRLEALDQLLQAEDDAKGAEPMSSNVEAKVTHRFKSSAERVYDAWLDPQRARAWTRDALINLGLSGDVRRVEIDARVGGRFCFSDMRDGKETVHWGTYLELDRPRKIVFTWILDESEESDPCKVTLTLKPDGDGCFATIVHELHAKWADYLSQTQDGWSRMLEAVDALLRQGDDK